MAPRSLQSVEVSKLTPYFARKIPFIPMDKVQNFGPLFAWMASSSPDVSRGGHGHSTRRYSDRTFMKIFFSFFLIWGKKYYS